MTKNMMAAFRKYAPQVQVHVYLHKNLCSEQNNREKYTDSLALDSTSRRLSKVGISAYYQPTLNNTYGKALSKVYRRMVEEFDANIYMDEICLSVTVWEHYPEWDQCTAIINPLTHKVTGTISIPNLLVRPWLDEMLAYLKSKNKKLIANGPPATRTLHEYNAWHFVEQGMGINGMVAAHFSTPLGFCYHHGKKGFEHFRDALECGFVCFLYSGDWSRHCFPFTPIELHNGYIVCRERIITKVSGKFGWNDKCDADIFVYDGNGKPTIGQEVKSTTENGKSVFEVRMPSDHVAIIVKK